MFEPLKAIPTKLLPTEDEEQSALVKWLELKNILFFHIPNGSNKGYFQRSRFKKLGLKRGVPDIFIPLANKSFHGLFIELKRLSGGKTSDCQKEWLVKLNNNGYLAMVCKGWTEAKSIIEEYLDAK